MLMGIAIITCLLVLGGTACVSRGPAQDHHSEAVRSNALAMTANLNAGTNHIVDAIGVDSVTATEILDSYRERSRNIEVDDERLFFLDLLEKEN